jgi:hypothetical protein
VIYFVFDKKSFFQKWAWRFSVAYRITKAMKLREQERDRERERERGRERGIFHDINRINFTKDPFCVCEVAPVISFIFNPSF